MNGHIEVVRNPYALLSGVIVIMRNQRRWKMKARNRTGIERFFTKYTKAIMSHNYMSKREAEALAQNWEP